MSCIAFSPNGRLFIDGDDPQKCGELVRAFQTGSGAGLLYLDLVIDVVTEDPAFAYWKDFARLYLSLFAATPNLEKRDLKSDPVKFDLLPDDFNRFLAMVPPMKGAEYVDVVALARLWNEIGSALHSDILNSGKEISEYFTNRHSSLNLLGRVCFHLAENKNSTDAPFAFLATYARQMSKEGKPQHRSIRH